MYVNELYFSSNELKYDEEKGTLKRLEEAEQRANEADKAWEQDPNNEELEKAFDEAYKAQHEASENLAIEIYRQTYGDINIITARTMIRKYREALKLIIEKEA